MDGFMSREHMDVRSDPLRMALGQGCLLASDRVSTAIAIDGRSDSACTALGQNNREERLNIRFYSQIYWSSDGELDIAHPGCRICR